MSTFKKKSKVLCSKYQHFVSQTTLITIETELKQMHNKRIKESFFEEDQNLNIKISWITVKITNKLKDAEQKLKEFINVRTTDKSDE